MRCGSSVVGAVVHSGSRPERLQDESTARTAHLGLREEDREAAVARGEHGRTRELAIWFVDDHQPSFVGATVCGGCSGSLARWDREPGVEHAERFEDPPGEVIVER